ncbi:MAG: beta-lactamase family protein [Rhizobiaceae bacterium]|nr:beta-lactamase family protein [Rhizobiaceae bacterium]
MRIVTGLGLGLLAALAGGFAYLRSAPPELLKVGTGYSAKIICSNVFLAGRDADEVLRVDVQAPGHPLLRLVRAEADMAAGEVRTSLIGGIAPARAVFRQGYGCTLLPDGMVAAEDVPPVPEIMPAHVWREAPDDRLAALLNDEALAGPGMRATVVVKNGAIIAERYGDGFSASTPLLGWSMTKSMTGLLVGALEKMSGITRDKVGLFPDWSDDRAKIRLSDLLAMQSGLAWNEGYGGVSDVTRMLFLSADMQALAQAQPAEAPPGSTFNYSSGTTNLVMEEIEDAWGDGAQTLPRALLFNPLGMASAVVEPDASGTLVGSSYMYATARDWARLGQFMIAGGVVGGEALLPRDFTHWMVQPTEASGGAYGQGHVWMADADDGAETGLPKGSYRFSGHDGQSVIIVPSERLIVVRMGLTPSRTGYQPYPLVNAVRAALAR